IGDLIDQGRFVFSTELEDIHMNIEKALTERTPAGAKLHTGRSRNDQIATDLRLWLKHEVARDLEAVSALQRALVDWAAREEDIVLPGYTHLQRGQPVLLGHHLLAYVEMLERDKGRFTDAAQRADVCPLGSGALAGSTLPLDRKLVADLLGFGAVSENSMDAISDRDFVVEYCAASALLAVHLSRLSEDLILWNSSEFGFITIGDAYTTGSSLMPQKKNPDVAELTRGKTGRVVGNLVSLLTTLKSLPMTYNRDLQEDKERLFDTADTVAACLTITAEMLGTIKSNPQRCFSAAEDPLLLATDLADWLVQGGMPFREAHHVVGQCVAAAEAQGLTLDRLPLAEMQRISKALTEEAREVFALDRALDARDLPGAPSPKRVRAQVRKWQRRLG
ncbi:MAG: argininosuccinate lyase, partial [Verrucomicrobiota bacterium]